MMSSQPTSQNSTQTSDASSAASVFPVLPSSHIASLTPPSGSNTSHPPTNPAQFLPAATSTSLPTFMSSSVASTGGQLQTSYADGSRFQAPTGLPVGGMPMPVPGTVPPVMPVPIIPPHFATGSADLLPVDPYLPCNSRHFFARRASGTANQSNASIQVLLLFISVPLFILLLCLS
jgi:hypothetical protein